LGSHSIAHEERMTKKQPRVPGMRSSAPNRAQRRGSQRPEDQEPMRERPQPESQDVASVRAKSSGHRKKTADNWNQ
jgi:hypothetical protein